MPEDKSIPPTKGRDVLQTLSKSGAVDFDKLGEMVKTMPETALGPDVVAADYIVSVGDKVLHVWELGISANGLEEVAKVRDLADRQRRLVRS